MITDAILVAAGQGERFKGSLAKQFQSFAGQAMWAWSHAVLVASPHIRRCVIVIPDGMGEKFLGVDAEDLVTGGASRSDSVRAGLAALSASGTPPEAVLIHDAARPGLSPAVIDRVVDALTRAEAAAPALAVTDALKRVELGGGLSGVDRSNLHRVQTPQGFHFGLIKRALGDRDDSLVDDLAAVEALGAQIALVEGDAANDKITFPEDRHRVERLMGLTAPNVRVGSGYDVHALEPGDHVILCGLKIPHSAALKGHSDADVAWHTLTDAILGALALGDIGDHFPPSDPQWKGAPSDIFLKAAAGMARDRGYEIGNLDITIICEAPKIGPHRDAMRQSTAECLGLPLDQVSVKATTTERLGFTGREEGIAAEAVVMLVRS
ncbi:MAG: bifunctional 2-C-methyl-D-erythritol 4-phosphate cytidylyltransferase/2-C-methyl-D-erythritol 2,4-cyclodiphosphate synthase [Pseudomonadota bacterium]